MYCSNKTHCCLLRLVNQFAIVFVSKVFPALAEKLQDRGSDKMLLEPYDRHTPSWPFSQYCYCSVYWILFFRKWSTICLIFCITNTRNLFHILLWWYKELFSHYLDKGVSLFYVFSKQSGAVPVSFIHNEKSWAHAVPGTSRSALSFRGSSFLSRKENHRLIEQLSLEKTLRGHLFQTILVRSYLDKNITLSQCQAASWFIFYHLYIYLHWPITHSSVFF